MKFHFKKLDYYQWTDCALHTLSTDSSKVVYNFYFSKCMITEIDCLMLYYLEIVCVASLVIKIATSAFPRQLFCLLVMICTLFFHNITSCSLFLSLLGEKCLSFFLHHKYLYIFCNVFFCVFEVF